MVFKRFHDNYSPKPENSNEVNRKHKASKSDVCGQYLDKAMKYAANDKNPRKQKCEVACFILKK